MLSFSCSPGFLDSPHPFSLFSHGNLHLGIISTSLPIRYRIALAHIAHYHSWLNYWYAALSLGSWTINANENRYSHRRSPSCIYNGLPRSASLKRPPCVVLPNHLRTVHVPLPCLLHRSATNQTCSPLSHFRPSHSCRLPTRYLAVLLWSPNHPQ